MGNSISWPLVIPAITDVVKHLMELIFKKPPEQPCPVDSSILEQAKRELDEKEKELDEKIGQLKLEETKLKEGFKVEKARLDSRGAARYKSKEPAQIEFLRQQAFEKLGLDSVRKINICITGKAGVGKSSLINGLRRLEPGDLGAAEVDVNECTQKMANYPYPKSDHVVLWDVPGADTLKHPRETYFFDNFLYAFDYLLIVFTERFGESEIDLIKQSIAHHIPFACIRNKANIDLIAKSKTDKEFRRLSQKEAINNLIAEHRTKTMWYLHEAGIDSKDINIFIINAHSFVFEDEVAFEEPKLIEHVLKTIGKRRGYDMMANASAIASAIGSAASSLLD